jgi:hypothetical protein
VALLASGESMLAVEAERMLEVSGCPMLVVVATAALPWVQLLL